jgi:hypothetical protein
VTVYQTVATLYHTLTQLRAGQLAGRDMLRELERGPLTVEAPTELERSRWGAAWLGPLLALLRQPPTLVAPGVRLLLAEWVQCCCRLQPRLVAQHHLSELLEVSACDHCAEVQPLLVSELFGMHRHARACNASAAAGGGLDLRQAFIAASFRFMNASKVRRELHCNARQHASSRAPPQGERL